ncbi:hypothetical protein [Siphonobacter aquaeclarae]|uniref:Surface antigen n=1 Tax=Siphonobacter aquaeclarae TaxID=563176 RepID=A0A1G9U3Q7_9BACT|nr:hypothetical protein [Siphonobacter aquaeclarae]SDM54522.1 hypothetical protein SAMN04488090_3656 [Siphonobacter aquaeclarae]
MRIGMGFFLLGWLLLPSSGTAQKSARPDTLPRSVARKDTLPRLTPAQRDSIRFTNLRTKMKKRNWTGSLYDLLFRYPYNTNAQNQEVSKIEENPFKVYSGRIIRNIYVKRLDVFGPSIYDTTRVASNWFERLGNRLHHDTREQTIRRSLLLFKEGEEVNPDVLKDNERVLRQTPILHDARIFVLPVANYSHVVDILVVTQDLWSLIPDGSASGPQNFNFAVEQKNVRGMAHAWKTGIAYKGDAPYQPLEFFSRYSLPYIGRSLTTTQLYLDYLRDKKQVGARLQKDFITPEIKYAGAFEVSLVQENKFVFVNPNSDTTVRARLRYGFQDAWFGRAFKLGFRDQKLNSRTRLILAARTSGYGYLQRSNLPAGAENLFPGLRVYLGSIGYSNRNYERDVLIYGFGRTEDVPVGFLASLTWGKEKSDIGLRTYSSLRLAHGTYLGNKKGGYLYALTSVSGYLEHGHIQQGTFNIEANYFSPLMTHRRSSFRHFVTFKYTAGINRFQYEYLTLNNNDGIPGVSSNFLRGTNRAIMNLQSVFFSPFQMFGFRTAFVGFIDLGLLSFDNSHLFSNIYQGYGIGFRFRNENLTFNTFQVRLGYYPNFPGITNRLRIEGSGESVLRMPDFRVEAPDRVDLFRTSR